MNLTASEVANFWAKVSKAGETECWSWTGCISTHGYGKLKVNGKSTSVHRIAFHLACGVIPDGKVIDHICRNRSCVNPAHLRCATQKQNTEHRPSASANSSGHRGVSFHKRSGKWQARVSHFGQPHFLGYFDDQDAAAQAVQAKRNELYTHNDIDRKEASR